VARNGATPHGTANGYRHYECRCSDCREAWRVYFGDLRRKWRTREQERDSGDRARAPRTREEHA
jgi:hypothetical protein